MTTKKSLRRLAVLTASTTLTAFLALSAGVQADDTDVFFSSNPNNAGQRNLLIVLDNTTNWSGNDQGFPSGNKQGQAEVLAIKNAISVLDSSTNVGLMMFNSASGADAGGYVRYHMRPMNDTNKAEFTAVLDFIASESNFNNPDEDIPSSNARYGDLFRDAYNYLAGGNAIAPAGVDAFRADEAGYDTAYGDFKSPLTSGDANCGPTSIVFVSNPASNGPRPDSAANTAALAAAGGNTSQLTVPTTVTYTTVTGAGTEPIGSTLSCLPSLAACTAAVRAADFPSQCGIAADCSCRERFHTTTTTTATTTNPPAATDGSTSTITTTNNGSAPADPVPNPSPDSNPDPNVTTTTFVSTVTTDATTTELPACGAGTQRYTVKGVTNDTAPVSDSTSGPSNVTTSPVVTACLKSNQLPYTVTCPQPNPRTDTFPNTPASGQTTTVTTTWANCRVPSGAAHTGVSCTAQPGGNGSRIYNATGDRTVRTVVTNDSATQTFTTLGNTLACCASSASCGVGQYGTAVAGSNNDCTDFNGGCAITGPTSPNLTPAHGSCPAGSRRYEVTSNASTTAVSPNVVDGRYVPTASTSAPGDGANMDEWARMLKTVGVNGKKINTYTIDVFKNQPVESHTKLMLSAARVGGGRYFSGTSQAEIANALNEILEEVLDINTTFAAPAVTVNTFNRLTNRNELYFALFRPDAGLRWEGNLKKYKFGEINGAIRIVDDNNADAVDNSTGFFKSTARSIWSALVDGSEVALGGMASNLTVPRNAYTYVGADLPPSATPTPVDLSLSAQRLSSSNTGITRDLVGLAASAPAADLANVLNWGSGIDVDDNNFNDTRTDARQSIGDPLHSQPVVITYKGTDASPDLTIYFGDNEGSFYAVTGATGALKFSFTPKETLRYLSRFRSNLGTRLDRPYGLDGPITKFHNDLNGDLLPLNVDGTVQSGEFVYLYVGMRRGGRNYYSLDVTNRDAPKLRWVIYGGSGQYTELAQTWSKPVVTKIKLNGVIRDVIIFTGGYDPAQDNKAVLSPDSQGRAVYIADARTGERLWWGSSVTGANLVMSQMVYSLPASPKVIDLNGDAIADRIYLSDAGGQIFRIFLNGSNTGAANLASGGRIAVLSDADTVAGSRTAANARRFFASPDLALINKDVSAPFLSIAIGSGFRERPTLTENNDRFYVLRDPDDEIGENSPLTITEADLYDATANVIGQGDAAAAAVAQANLDASKGFYINLVDGLGAFVGEKVIADSLTFENKVIFSSFQNGTASTACTIAGGRSRLYLLSVVNGTPAVDFSTYTGGTPTSCAATSCDSGDRYISLAQQGLPPDPTLLFPALGSTLPDEALVCIGAECFEPGLTIETKKTYWLKKSN